jgi:hypothetical protein
MFPPTVSLAIDVPGEEKQSAKPSVFKPALFITPVWNAANPQSTGWADMLATFLGLNGGRPDISLPPPQPVVPPVHQ